MRRIFLTLLIIFLGFWTKPIWIEPVREFIPESVTDTFDSVKEFANQMLDGDFSLDQVREYLPSPNREEIPERESLDRPELTVPGEQAFSIANIELGDSKAKVTELYGDAVRVSMNEYGIEWFTYHENYQTFIMVAYDEDEVVQGLFTNQDLLTSQLGLTMEDSKQHVRDILGAPEEIIHYPGFRYQVNDSEEYDIFLIDRSYITIFYDIHEEDRITAVQIIDQDLEDTKSALYTPGNEALKEGFEYQLFDLTNATRVSFGLPILEWDENVRETARNHSTDMAVNQFFSHTNLENQTFSDRLKEDGIKYMVAGENLAYGQLSSIFAHQGLMNSEGHRKNILHHGYKKVGIGVDFNDVNHPFYTVKFYTGLFH